MKIKIEVYKSQTIEYDDEADKFICYMVMEDVYKSTKRASLKEVRKEIDLFLKANIDFQPFKAIEMSMWSSSNFSVVEVKAIRSDGTFVVCDIDSPTRKNYYTEKDMQRLRVYDPEIVAEEELMEIEVQKLNLKHENKRIELASKLTPIDLSRYYPKTVS